MLTVPTPHEVSEAIQYDPSTGEVRRNGKIVGSPRKDGYVRVHVLGRHLYVHRIALAVATGRWPGIVDHINGKRSDNRLCNLREVTHAENMQNVSMARRSNKNSRLLGAHWSHKWKRWKSSIHASGRPMHLGWFDTEQEAHAAYLTAKRRLHSGAVFEQLLTDCPGQNAP